jgi:mono/diheme cytochrome c family protein
MGKRPFVIFGVFAAICIVAIPLWAVSKEGSGASVEQPVAAADEEDKELFAGNCGPCHTLEAAGTDGVVGPNLDELLGTTPDIGANTSRVETAVLKGIEGRMPAGILQGDDAERVAQFVSENVDYVSDPGEQPVPEGNEQSEGTQAAE